MGMFDSYYARCKCGGKAEFQSKAGDCVLAEYSRYKEPPADVAADLIGQEAACDRCGLPVTLKGVVMLCEVWDE